MIREIPPVIVIGAGPAGLAVAGRLRMRGVEAQVIDRAARVGDAWRNHYDRLHLHTVKELSGLPGLAFPASAPRYVPRRQVVDYLEAYKSRFDIALRGGTTVTAVERDGDAWTVHHDGGRERAAHVVVATGLNRVPHRPRFAGESEYGGRVLHSRDYRNPEPFLGGAVLVVGMGNTGAEIALDLCEHEVRCEISVRGPVNIVPREVLGRPTQRTAILLDRLPRSLGSALGRAFQRLSVGDLRRFGISTPELAPIEQLRRLGRTPVVDVGTVDRIRAGEIEVRPGLERFTEGGVRFVDGTEGVFSAVILATGYRPELESLVPVLRGRLDANGCPFDPVGRGELAGLYFTGFDNYSPGGVLLSIARESEQIAEAIAGG